VLTAVTDTADVNGVALAAVPDYTDIDGNILGPVGTGTIPAGTWGVHAAGDRDFSTFLGGVIGLGTFRASAEATAITGYVEEVAAGGLIPLTFPLIVTQCETGGGSNRLYHPFGNPPDGEWPYGPANLVALPLCANGPGNVGWIDWDPPFGGAADVADSIRTPDSGPVSTPKWYFVAETGGITSLDDDMDIWENTDILLPIFYVEVDDPATPQDESVLGTCDTEPNGTKTQKDDCPDGHNGGTGQNQWYYLVDFAEFHLVHSYIQGNHQAECNDTSTLAVPATVADTGNQINTCLIGYFKGPVLVSEATVGVGPPESSSTPLGVQLIR
jgi:hypothetical protein